MKEITEKTLRILGLLIPEGNIDSKIKRVMIDGLKRKLAEFQLINYRLQKKYGMTFEEFEKRNIVKEKGFSYEVESDYHEWDAAIDAIKTLKNYLEELTQEE